jgi:ADP-ribose pyrophosphatase YjhB (NUDIX family)
VPAVTTKPILLDLAPSDVHTPSSMATVSAAKPGLLAKAALAVVHDDGGRILTVARPEPPHEMALPGGMIEDGETEETAAARELTEETGIKADVLEHILDTRSPVDGRVVSIFRVTRWSGEPSAAEGNPVQWMKPIDLVAQATHFRPTLRELMPHILPEGEMAERANLIDAAKRNALAESKFALPAQRKYPIDTAARTRNAAARLEQQRKAGKISDADYKTARVRIAAAAKSFGIDSEFNARAGSPPAAAAKRPAGRGRGTIHVRADLAPGGALHVRHMTTSEDGAQAFVQLSDGSIGLRDIRAIKQGDEVDPATAGVKLIGKATWSDGTPKTLVWIQVAECGAWRGHPAGPFEMTPKTFAEIKANFDQRGLPVPFDYEHASEQDATSGSIPISGAPAPGWVHKLDNRGIGGLWGLVEWLDVARNAIKEGSYAFLSPAIRFGCKHPVTGQPIGARLTSVALTNQPFLTSLDDLRAAKDDSAREALLAKSPLLLKGFGENVIAAGGSALLDRMVHSPSGILPKIKAALKLHPLATLDDVSGHLGKLREACMSADAGGSYCGEPLSDYLGPLTDLANPGLGATYTNVLDALDAFVDAEIEKHVFQGVPMPDPPSAAMDDDFDDGGGDLSDRPEKTMSDKTATTLKDAQDELAKVTAVKESVEAERTQLLADKQTLATEKTNLLADKVKLEGENSTLTLQLRDATQKATEAGEALSTASASIAAASTALVLKDKETLAEGAARIVADNVRLAKEVADIKEAGLVAAVDDAFAAYSESKKLRAEDKPMMLRSARADREAFDALYPPVSAAHRHLLTTVVTPEKRPEVEQAEASDPIKVMSETGCNYAEALARINRKKPE